MKGIPKKELHISQIFVNIRDLEKLWGKIKSILISDDLEYPASSEETVELNSKINNAKELIRFLAKDLELFFYKLEPRGFTIRWSIEDIQKWEKKILKKIAYKTYIDKNKANWYKNFSIIDELIFEPWFKLVPLLDCLELPKSSKKYWEILKGFCLGVVASIAASLLIKLLS
jgi:hypothetical protein